MMAGNIGPPPVECPSCATAGMRSLVKFYQINLEQAAVFCENAFCAFPLFSQDACPLVVQQTAVPAPAANPKLKTRSMDTESMTSTCSVSSWTSHASTVSSISSNVATPPPSISNKPFIWPSNQYAAYQPKAMAPKQKNVFDWITPISSSQSSPASSIISFNDREVEMVMGKSTNLTSTSGLTPSPTPSLSDILDAVGSQPANSNDSYIESLCSFLDEVSEAPTSTYSVPTTEETTSTTTELTYVRPATLIAEPIAPRILEASTPVGQSKKRMIDETGSGESPSQESTSLNVIPESTTAWQNIELPLKASVRSKKPRTCVAKGTRVSRGASSSNESAITSTPSPQPKVLQPLVAVDINDEGKHVFTIHPVTPTPSRTTPKPRSSAKKVQASASAVRSSRTSKPPKAATAKPAVPKRSSKKKDSFCIQTLTEKYIEAAKNKKLANPKAP